MGLEEILAKADPFSADATDTARLLWDYSVHEYYCDTCDYFLVRYRSPPRDPLAKLREVVEGLGIGSYYVYLLFGQFDVLLRMWTTPGKIRQFRTAVRGFSSGGLIQEAHEFQASDIRFLFRSGPAEGEGDSITGTQGVEAHIDEIGRIVEAQRANQSLVQYRQEIGALIDSGLIHMVGPTEKDQGEYFRFAISVQRLSVTDLAPSLDIVCRITKKFNTDRPAPVQIERVAVYKGIGFAEYLLTGIVQRYEALFDFNQFLRHAAADDGFPVRTETYLNATRQAIERDRIDPLESELTAVQQRLVRFLHGREDSKDPQVFAQRLLAMDVEGRNQVTNVFAENEGFLKTPFRKYFRSFLVARVTSNQELLAQAMTCLLEIEGRFVSLCIRCWQERFKQSWHPNARDAARMVGLDAFNPKEPTLKEALDVTGKMASMFPEMGTDPLAKYLGNNWRTELDRMGSYRNDIAHGRLFAQRDYLEKKWADLARELGTTGTFYNRLAPVIADAELNK